MTKLYLILALSCAGFSISAQNLPNYKDSFFVVNFIDTIQLPTLNRTYVQVNGIPPRFQWNSNAGYCGEVSMISAGLYYGQYISQCQMRKIASHSADQRKESQLLLGVNDAYAANCVRLKYEAMQACDSRSFMAWVKNHVALGHPVIVGVFNNINQLGEDSGDPEFDHIVPVIGFASNKPLYMGPDSSDIILLSDNGLYTPATDSSICIPWNSDSVPYLYSYELNKFFLNRDQANNPNGNTYSLLSLPEYQSPSFNRADIKKNYGIAITGVMGDEELLPVRITTNINYESPCPNKGQDFECDNFETEKVTLTITVSGLKPDIKYHMYKYDDEMKVPIKDFNVNSKEKPWKDIKISSGSTYTTSINVKMYTKVFIRVVPAD